MTQHIITLADIRAHHPCEDGWRKLINALGTSDPNTRLTIGDVAAANGANDAFWCLRCIDDPRVRVAAIIPTVKRASAYAADQSVHDCIAAIERWLDGDDSVDLQSAAEAAWAAAEAAAEAADAAALAARSSAWAAAAAAWVAAAAAEAAAEAADAAALAARSSAWAAAAAAEAAAEAAAAAERARQRDDLIETFGLLAMKKED